MPKSKLEKLVSKKLRMTLTNIAILENTRPDWLISSQGERLELDFYIPTLDIAIEVQGQQHYTFVSHFHLNQNGFTDQLRRDREKRYLCECKGITLLEITSSSEINGTISKITSRIKPTEASKEFVTKMKNQNKTAPRRNIKGKKLRKTVRLIEMRNNILKSMDRSEKNDNRQNALDNINTKLDKMLR